MQKALEVVYQIFNGLVNFMFTSYIFEGVSVGMIIIVCMLFALMINSLLNLPSGVNDVLDRRIRENKSEEIQRQNLVRRQQRASVRASHRRHNR